ncbi:glycosyltransferase family 2 protein [Sulfurirhabdus autotrophica]|uniref:GT2 family glycosyltransferase n=1 Tax=Sulfurirhabdus autotrophica TaxID=1706046 RepID=A0A4R3Y8C7_9PROT|nr:glycosyltransferase [Sulfurirhabdus autotrophica]TCV88126.1 GT2 family glycosyltransferase [Sulfurirhabdus autotrophica]
MPPFITVALCTHNHVDRIKRTLADLAQLQPPVKPWEFLVIDNGCADGTSELLAEMAWRPAGVAVRVVREENLGLSNARNRALQEAHGEYLLFMDDDETPDPAWLVVYEQAMLEHQPDALGGRIEVLFEDGERPDWLQDELLGFLGKLDHGEARWLTERTTPIFGGNFAFRLSVFDRIGNFDARLGRQGSANNGGEDTEIYRRLLEHGCRVRWVPGAIIQHRIQTPKLRRDYFLDLHFRQGRMEGARKRGNLSRVPPRYLVPQILRAYGQAIALRLKKGSAHSLRQEMNAAYFTGYVVGWMKDPI